MIRYKMLARDIDAQPAQYRTWIVDGEPDLTAQFYTGDKAGTNPLVDVSAYAIFDPGQVCDFNLPNALDWNTTYKTLPGYVCDGQVAVIDGYIYLFGGQNSNKIFQAPVGNPSAFQDTGATLPTPLAGAQLIITNNTIYLFGGMTSASLSSGTSTIFSAPVSNPLSWTNNGSLLPIRLHHSQLAIIGNFIYLFGGNSSGNAVGNILAAPLFNPLSWVDTGFTLPVPLYGSHLGIADGYVYLFGGLLSNDTPTANIYSATLTQPLIWRNPTFLPYPVSYGQFCTIGANGYLFVSPASNSPSYTKILSCNLSNPLSWVDTQATVAGTATQSHLAIVYDRLWLYGGNGSTVILANNSIVKYNLDDAAVFQYGNVTRTQVEQAQTQSALFQVLGFAPWRTDYGS